MRKEIAITTEYFSLGCDEKTFHAMLLTVGRE
jgi:hypothetical protein